MPGTFKIFSKSKVSALENGDIRLSKGPPAQPPAPQNQTPSRFITKSALAILNNTGDRYSQTEKDLNSMVARINALPPLPKLSAKFPQDLTNTYSSNNNLSRSQNLSQLLESAQRTSGPVQSFTVKNASKKLISINAALQAAV